MAKAEATSWRVVNSKVLGPVEVKCGPYRAYFKQCNGGVMATESFELLANSREVRSYIPEATYREMRSAAQRVFDSGGASAATSLKELFA